MGRQCIIDFTGFIGEDEQRVPIVIRISEAHWNEKTSDWYCELFAPRLFDGTKKIYGIDESQAQDLAVSFVQSLLGNRPLYNQEGQLAESPFNVSSGGH